MTNWLHLFFSPQGRIPRSRFWLGVGAIVGFQLLVQIPVMNSAGLDPAQGNMPVWFRNLSLALDVICAWPLYAVVAKRQEDRNQPPHLAFYLVAALLVFSVCEAFQLTQSGTQFTMLGYVVGLPLVALIILVIIELGIRAGTEGPNRFGPDPLR